MLFIRHPCAVCNAARHTDGAAQGQVLRRVHQDQRRADLFNPGARGNARFSPIRDDPGRADSDAVWRRDDGLRADENGVSRRALCGRLQDLRQGQAGRTGAFDRRGRAAAGQDCGQRAGFGRSQGWIAGMASALLLRCDTLAARFGRVSRERNGNCGLPSFSSGNGRRSPLGVLSKSAFIVEIQIKPCVNVGEGLREVLTPPPVGVVCVGVEKTKKALKRPLKVRIAFLRACATRQTNWRHRWIGCSTAPCARRPC